MIKQLLILCVTATLIVAAVRFLLITGLNMICTRFHWSPKVKGQLIGYATSLPELVVILTSAWAGVFSAGFWNVASSNIINCFLFSMAIFFYRQVSELKSARFYDELLFTILSIALPIGMYFMHLSQNLHTAILLIAVFIVYKWLDIVFNAKQDSSSDSTETPERTYQHPLRIGLPMMAGGILLIMFAGRFLGSAAENLVQQLNIPGWLVGWILGFITSVPEMASFFEIYRLERRDGNAHSLRDTQQALDALVSSNLSNLGIILPAGILLFLLIH